MKQYVLLLRDIISLLVFPLVLLLGSGCTRNSSKIDEGFLGGVYLSQSKSNIVVGTRSLMAGASTTVTLSLKDQNGENYIPSIENPVTITFGFESGTSTGVFSSVTDNKDGTYTTYLTGTGAGTASTVTASINGKSLDSVLPTVTVISGNYSLSNSYITLSANTLQSGSSLTAVLHIKDNANNPLTSGGLSVTFSTTGSGTSSGTFTSVVDNNDGTYSTTFTGTTAGSATAIRALIGVTPITSSLPSVTVNPGSASKLVILQQPNSGISNQVLTSQPIVAIKDLNNNTVVSLSSNVTMVISANPASGTLSGTTTIAAVNGVATFSNLKIDKSGTGYTLSATSSGLVSATSTSFNIAHGSASQLAFTIQPSGTVAGLPFTTQPVITIQDTAGNTVTSGVDSSAVLSMSLNSGTGSLSGTTSVVSVLGVATYSNLSIDAYGSKTLLVTKPDLTGSGGTSQLTQTSSAFTNSTNPPSVPTGLTATVGNASVAMTWTGVTSATSYNILRGTTSGSLTQIASSTTNAYTDSTPTNGTTYYYAVQAVNAAGTSASSSEMSAKAISSFTISSATVSGSSAIAVSWNAATGASNYSVNYSTSNGGPYSLSGCSSSSTSCLISSLTAGTTYYFMVTATNSVGVGASIDANLQMSAIPISSFSITGVTTSGISTASGSVALTFGSATGASAYTVTYGTTTGQYTTTATTNATSPYTVANLAAGTTYYFMVTATNSNGSLNASTEVSKTPYRTFQLDIPFTTGTIADYTVNSASYVEFVSNVARLKMADQIDNVSNSFSSSTGTGVGWSSASGVVRLSIATNNSELDASWTPKWSNLVTYFKFNGSGSVPLSGSSFPADKGSTTCYSNNSSNTYVDAKLHQGVQLFESRSMNCTGTEVGNISDNVTMSGWVKVSNAVSATSYAALVYNNWDNSTGNTKGFAVQRQGTTSSVYLRIDSVANQNTSCNSTYMTALDGAWHHVAYTLSSFSATSATVKAYMDGQLYKTCTVTYNTGGIATSSTLTFKGVENTGQTGTTIIDDWGFWNSVLSDSEVKTIYLRQAAKYSGYMLSRVFDSYSASQTWTSVSATTVMPFGKELIGGGSSESTTYYSGLSSNFASGNIGLWRFNETAAGTVAGSKDFADVSTSATTHLKGYGSLTYGVSSTTGRALQFYSTPGTYNGYAIASMTALNTTQSYTVSTWVRSEDVSSTANNRTIVSKTGNSYPAFILGYVGTTKLFRFVVYSNDSSPSSYTSYATVSATVGRWTHLVGVYDSSTSKAQLYLDGVPQSQVSVAGTFNAGQNIMIGGTIWGGGNVDLWPGSVDEVAIWNRVLSSSEILQLYRRYANRLKYQIRTCSSSDCSDQESLSAGKGWKGYDNSAYTYFSESQNNSSVDASGVGTGSVNTSNMNLSFSALATAGVSVPASQYIQYRTIFESDDQNSLCSYGNCSPELQAVGFGPDHYATTEQIVTTSASYLTSQFRTLDASGTGTSFVETLGSNGCSTGVRYSLSRDGASYYYWNGSAWSTSDGTYASGAASATLVRSNISTFPTSVGSGTLYIKTFLKSNGTTPCEIDQVSISGQKD